MRRWLAALVLLATLEAQAFSVGTGFSSGCHERLTASLYSLYVVDLRFSGIELPRGEPWRKLSDAFTSEFHLEAFDDTRRAIIVSVLLGVRAPDTHSHSLFELSATRDIHLDPADQSAHALRGVDDDGPAGDTAALLATRAHLKRKVSEALAHLDERMTVSLALDFYGKVEVEVLRGPFHLGEALHALQDAFSHMLRTPDFQRVQHVMNFVDAMSTRYDEARDGLRHSSGLDVCDERGAGPAQAARVASLEFLDGLFQEGPEGADRVVESWLAHTPGCSIENAYCDNEFVPAARASGTTPLLGCSMTGAVPLVVLAALLLRRRRAAALSLSLTACGAAPAPLDLSCEAMRRAEACGGDLEGRWYVLSSCLRPLEVAAPPTCEEPSVVLDLTATGALEVRAEQARLEVRGRLREVLLRPRSCSASGDCLDVPGLDDGFPCSVQGDACACSRGGVGREVFDGPITRAERHLEVAGERLPYCARDGRLVVEVPAAPRPLLLGLGRAPSAGP
ncbi:MAG: hypothetical protein INH41_01145 [Myxococcaceae bacterium]|nr:hypothetical protein [Myxococcaceae bacterium]MCA3010984.1 hypothetical protein [Myxococcaceae bacterium]